VCFVPWNVFFISKCTEMCLSLPRFPSWIKGRYNEGGKGDVKRGNGKEMRGWLRSVMVRASDL